MLIHLFFPNQGQSWDKVYDCEDNQYSNWLTTKALRRMTRLFPDECGAYRWKILKVSGIEGGCKLKRTTERRYSEELDNKMFLNFRRSKKIKPLRQFDGHWRLKAEAQDFSSPGAPGPAPPLSFSLWLLWSVGSSVPWCPGSSWREEFIKIWGKTDGTEWKFMSKCWFVRASETGEGESGCVGLLGMGNGGESWRISDFLLRSWKCSKITVVMVAQICESTP